MAITTNREYLISKLERFGVTENDVDIIIIENPELEGTINVSACKNAMYKSMSSILPTANVSEGGYSLTWNIEALKMWYKQLCQEIGKPNVLIGAIVNRTNYW